MFDELGPITTAAEFETHPTVSMTDRTVTKVAAARLPTRYGEYRLIGYESDDGEEFVVLTRGRFHADKPTLVRIHSQCMTGDVFGSLRCDCGQQLDAAMKMIAGEGLGAIVYQQQEGRGAADAMENGGPRRRRQTIRFDLRDVDVPIDRTLAGRWILQRRDHSPLLPPAASCIFLNGPCRSSTARRFYCNAALQAAQPPELP